MVNLNPIADLQPPAVLATHPPACPGPPGSFNSDVTSTIGASFFTAKMTVDNTRVKLQIWDTAGQERFRSMAPMYYRGAAAAIIVYDITQTSTFKDVEGWIDELSRNAEPGIIMAVVANKADVQTANSFPREIGQEYADKIGAAFYETSAKDDTGISDVFVGIAKELLLQRRASSTGTGAADVGGNKVALSADGAQVQAKSGCCGGTKT